MERDEIDKITKELDSLLSGSVGGKRKKQEEPRGDRQQAAAAETPGASGEKQTDREDRGRDLTSAEIEKPVSRREETPEETIRRINRQMALRDQREAAARQQSRGVAEAPGAGDSGARAARAAGAPGAGDSGNRAVQAAGAGASGNRVDQAGRAPGVGASGDRSAQAGRVPGAGVSGDRSAQAGRVPGAGVSGERSARAGRVPGAGVSGERAARAGRAPGAGDSGDRSARAGRAPGAGISGNRSAQAGRASGAGDSGERSAQAAKASEVVISGDLATQAAKELGVVRSGDLVAQTLNDPGAGRSKDWGVHSGNITNQTAGRRSRSGTRRPESAASQEEERGRSRKGLKSYTRPGDGLLVAFVVPIVVMIIIFAQRKIFPFGDESFLRTDMYHQYAPFFSEFQYKLTHGGSLLYSWDVGMGVNFSALYAYYLASPLNWLLVLCPKSLIIEFMTYSIVLKIGLCGLSFAYYLRKHCKTTDFGVGYFGIFYALSGYMAAYSWNIMWLDCLILFPFVMLGLERMIKGRSGLMYCVTLGLCILSNYYISIMICIFMVLYYIALQIMEKKKPVVVYLAGSLRFAIFSLAAGGLAAVVLLPEIYALQTTASGDFNFPQTLTSYFSIFDMLARHIGNVQTETGLDHWPNIYCGVAVLMFFLLYLACKKISVKEKTVYCSLLLIFFASFSINILNFIWHGFHYPNSLPCRQSFIYIALLLTMCCRVYMYLRETPWKHVVIAFWGAVCFVLLAEKMVTQTHFHFIVYYVAVIFLAAYAGLIYLYKKGKMKPRKVLLLALALVTIEAAVNTTVTSVTSTSRTNYMKDNQEAAGLLKGYINDTSFYRVDKVPQKTKNDGAWMNFPSVSIFSSTANEKLSKFFKSVGCESSTNAYSITGSTPLVDMLFSIKYRLYDSEQMNSQNMKLLGRDNDTCLYENLYTLPLGFLVPDNFDVDWQTSLGNPADVQNNLSDVAGASEVLDEVAGEVNGSSFTFTPETAGEYYVYVDNGKVKDVSATLGGRNEKFSNVNRGYLLELGCCEAGTNIKLESDDKEQEMTASAYRFSDTGLREVYEKLNQTPFQVTRWEDSRVEGRIEADRAGMMLMTIPYDKGWTVKVDGQLNVTRSMMDTFLGFYVPEGTHTVTMTYEPEGLKSGMNITLASLLFIVACVIWGCVIRSNQPKKQRTRRKRL